MNSSEKEYPTPASKALSESSITADATSFGETTSQEYTLYFIRHGEALHNILEKSSAATAKADAISRGYAPDSEYVKNVMEEARRAVLHSEGMEDPPLSELGMDEARRAKRELESLISKYNFPPVEEVWVSPLQRALKTASIIFPASSSDTLPQGPRIRVKEELEERHTGLPCDTASPFKTIKRPSFQHFSLSGLRLHSMEHLLKGTSHSSSMDKMDALDEERALSHDNFEDLTSDFGLFRLSGHPGDDDLWEQLGDITSDGSGTADINLNNTARKSPEKGTPSSNRTRKLNGSNQKKVCQKEDRDMLRERTKKLFDLLAQTKSRSICLIGKSYASGTSENDCNINMN